MFSVNHCAFLITNRHKHQLVPLMLSLAASALFTDTNSVTDAAKQQRAAGKALNAAQLSFALWAPSAAQWGQDAVSERTWRQCRGTAEGSSDERVCAEEEESSRTHQHHEQMEWVLPFLDRLDGNISGKRKCRVSFHCPPRAFSGWWISNTLVELWWSLSPRNALSRAPQRTTV